MNTDVTETPVTVNLSADSTWVVTEDSEISELNTEDGAQIVDTEGNAVTIVVNGETVVEGTSAITVTVSDAYSNEVTTSEANEIQEGNIDRTEFESYFES